APSGVSWSRHVNAWLATDARIIRFEDMTSNPRGTIDQIAAWFDLTPQTYDVPTFTSLKQIDPAFFRSGTNTTWQQEMSDHEEALFWALHGGTMEHLGYERYRPTTLKPYI